MILLFEEYQYKGSKDIELVKQCVDEAYLTETAEWVKIGCVGYFYCTKEKVNDAVFVLPKVFITLVDGVEMAFGKFKPEELIRLDSETKNKLEEEQKAIFDLSAWLYQAIAHYVERNPKTDIVKTSNVQEVASSKGEKSETYIDIILQLRKFQKEHRHLFTFISITNRSGSHKINWNKTVRKVQPFLQDGCPIYMDFYNKTKSINFDEELIVLFYSTLRFLQEKMRFKTVSDLQYDLIPVRKIESMIANGQGTRRLRTIRKKYFTDELVKLWNLLYVFFDKAEKIASGKYHDEKLLAIKFNNIFEDMIDQLIGDEDVRNLKSQKDGKVIDHLYKEDSLINNGSQVYFIGDSKYYKESTDLGETAVYKQFTYAKNIIQYHIDIFNDKERKHSLDKLCYRDEVTEGYNITPNFFIRASAIKKGGELYSYAEEGLENEFDTDKGGTYQDENGKTRNNKLINFHFPNRLFDRDTFVLQTYNINFLYVLAHYVQGADRSIQQSIRDRFRKDLIKRFNALYNFWVLAPKQSVDLQKAVDKHFRKIIGKVFRPYQDQKEKSNLLILALDKLSNEELVDESKRREHDAEVLGLLNELQEDFIVRPHQLGKEPRVYHLQYALPYSFESKEKEFLDIFEAAEPEIEYGINRIYLLGCYKSLEHYAWIKKRNFYNVRLGERRGAVDENDSFVACASHLVLYNFDKPKEFEIWRLNDTPLIRNKADMEKLSYPTPKGEKYLLYELRDEPFTKDIDVPKILEDNHVQKGEELAGAPIYLTGEELKEYCNPNP